MRGGRRCGPGRQGGDTNLGSTGATVMATITNTLRPCLSRVRRSPSSGRTALRKPDRADGRIGRTARHRCDASGDKPPRSQCLGGRHVKSQLAPRCMPVACHEDQLRGIARHLADAIASRASWQAVAPRKGPGSRRHWVRGRSA
jgi:hypothetical protein